MLATTAATRTETVSKLTTASSQALATSSEQAEVETERVMARGCRTDSNRISMVQQLPAPRVTVKDIGLFLK